MTLNKIINLVLLGAILYFGYNYIVPWFRSLGSGPGSRSFTDAGSGEEGKCVDAARRAAEVFSEEMRSFSRPPIDANAWDKASLRIENRLAAADDACSCSRPACGTAQSGLAGLRDLAGDFSRAARGDGAPPINGASAMNRAYDAFDMAAQQANRESLN